MITIIYSQDGEPQELAVTDQTSLRTNGTRYSVQALLQAEQEAERLRGVMVEAIRCIEQDYPIAALELLLREVER